MHSRGLSGDLTFRRLHEVLSVVRDRAGATFSGVGVVVTREPEGLPLIALRNESPELDDDLTVSLVHLSRPGSPFHDGFHILSPQGRLLRVAQYFSPPILPGVEIDRRRPIGARHAAALYGSALPDVLMTGIAGQAGGVSIFVNGAEVASGEAQC